MSELKIIVCGSREFHDYEYLENKLLEIIPKVQYYREVNSRDIEIVSGHALGADQLGEKFSVQYLKRFAKLFALTEKDWLDMTPPVWPKFRKDGTQYNARAGQNRNIKMIQYAGNSGIVIGFVKGESKGTKHTIREAKYEKMWTFKVDVDRDKVYEYNTPEN